MKYDICFIICCKYSSTDNYIFECVEKINSLYPESYILIIDSDSNDKSYFLDLKNKYPNINILENFANRNYEYGAIITGFNECKKIANKFCFIQDSIHINNRITELDTISSDTVVVLCHSVDAWGADPIAYEEFRKYHPDIDLISFDNVLLTLWNSFLIKTETFSKILDSEFFQEIKPPDNKIQSRYMERIWSHIFIKNNLKIKSISNQDNIKKIFAKRK